MSSTVENLFMIVCVTEFILGVFGNGFIVLINSKDWIRNGKISLTDFIITCLAISTMCFLIVISFHTFAENAFFSKCLLMSFAILWTASDYFCSACTTCLSVFYFFKISNFSNPVFLWMKWRIHKVLIMIVLGAIIYLCISLIFMETLTNFVIQEQVIMKKT
jgi:taste receptor type 2